MKLSSKQQQLLGGFYDTETYRVFRKVFMEDRQLEIAQATPFYDDMKLVNQAAGRIMELQQIEKELRKINSKSKTDS